MDKASIGGFKRRIICERKEETAVVMRKKKRNRGFTLVEVLVAAAILSLVVTPILSSFVSIARVNAKSRRKLSATTIANGVMEAVKNVELAQVAKECAFQSEGFTIIPGFTGTATEVSTGTTTAKAAADRTVTKNNGKYVFKVSTDEYYTFTFTDIAMDSTTYDVLLIYHKNDTNSAENVTVTMPDTTSVQKTTSEILTPMGVRVLTYYDVTVKVYRGGAGFTGKPLAEITGSKADYTKGN